MVEKQTGVRTQEQADRLEQKLNELFSRLWTDQGEALQQAQRQLAEDPEFELPEGYEARMRKALRKRRRPRPEDATDPFPAAAPAAAPTTAPVTRRPPRTRGLLRRAVLAALLAVLALGALAISSGAVRQWLTRFVTRDLGVATEIQLAGSGHFPNYAAQEMSQAAWLPTWVPDGYEITYFSQRRNGMVNVEFQTAAGGRIVYSQSSPTATILMDTEDAEVVEEGTFEGWQSLFTLKDGCGTVIWFDEEKNMYMDLTLYDYDEATMARIAAAIGLVSAEGEEASG